MRSAVPLLVPPRYTRNYEPKERRESRYKTKYNDSNDTQVRL
jgi:hypothetical protein